MPKGVGILIDDNGNIVVRSGSLAIGETTSQNQRIILEAEKGEIKEDPLLGVGVSSYLDDDDTSAFLREVRTNLRRDGQKVHSCKFVDGKLQLDAGYN